MWLPGIAWHRLRSRTIPDLPLPPPAAYAPPGADASARAAERAFRGAAAAGAHEHGKMARTGRRNALGHAFALARNLQGASRERVSPKREHESEDMEDVGYGYSAEKPSPAPGLASRSCASCMYGQRVHGQALLVRRFLAPGIHRPYSGSRVFVGGAGARRLDASGERPAIGAWSARSSSAAGASVGGSSSAANKDEGESTPALRARVLPDGAAPEESVGGGHRRGRTAQEFARVVLIRLLECERHVPHAEGAAQWERAAYWRRLAAETAARGR
ncbi:hypothetical protein C8R43DRAFT_1140755 [Mycena crocata]|nr:hypothetical protein C8R43DRAFT_1140755 [Mycena crocata]